MKRPSSLNAESPPKETSWLAQFIREKMDIESMEFTTHPTPRWRRLLTLKYIVNEADNPDNKSIYYDNYNGRRQIVISDIPSLTQHGTDYDREGMRGKLLGMQYNTKDDDGMYTMSVSITHDLNCAVIKDLMELLHQI